jgi:ABC-type glycerol-3-phosphate transport system substrate-binding protein
LIGNPDVVGNEPSWTFGELIAVLEANPQATSAFGVFTDGMALFQMIFMNHVDSFVNWETGIVDFDNDYFIEFLEFSVELRRVFNWWGKNRDEDGNRIAMWWGAEIMEEMVSSGEIIILESLISTFNSPYIIQRYFGKDFVFKGYPTDEGSGNFLNVYPRLAISSMSENKEGAWEFINMLLSEEWQRKNYSDLVFPSNRTVFEEGLSHAREGDEKVYWVYNIFPGQMREDPSAFVDKTLALINSAEGLPPGFDPLLAIIFEGIDDIFNGRSTPQEAARIIQSRAAIFVAEQS